MQKHSHDKSKRVAPPITTAEELNTLCQHLRTQDMIGFDTEFIRETTFFPRIALIQVATDTESWLVDPLVLKKADLAPLFEVFNDPKVIKILHAAQGDQECLFTTYGVTATPTLDTAQAASLLGFGDNVGLAKLLKEVMNINVLKGHARTDWSVRPLSEHLLQYAHADVIHLVPLARKLIARLDTKNRRQWAFDLSSRWEKASAFKYDAESQAKRFTRSGKLDERGFAAMIALLKWRESRASDVNIPRRRIADDDLLLDLARVRPQNIEHLATFRGLNKGELKNSGTALVEIFRQVNSMQPADLPEVPKPQQPTSKEARALEVLNCFLKIMADEHNIVVKHLFLTDDLLQLLRGKFDSPSDFVTQGILSVSGATLIGEELLAILKGKRAITVCLGGRGLEVKSFSV